MSNGTEVRVDDPLRIQRREQYFPLWKRGREGDFPLYASVLFLRRRPPGRRGWS
jgi:hypothetical protein